MSILSLNADERVKNVNFTEDSIIVDLMDGRTISAPLWGQKPPSKSNLKKRYATRK